MYDAGGVLRLEFVCCGEFDVVPPQILGEGLYNYIMQLPDVRKFVDVIASQGITMKYDDFVRFELCSGK